MFYYLDPNFEKDEGHHLAHQSILYQLYKDDFYVLANKRLTIEGLPYKVIRHFQSTSWQCLSNKELFGKFESEIIELNKYLSEEDIVFMYISDVLFIYPIINAKINHNLKGKFVLNL